MNPNQNISPESVEPQPTPNALSNNIDTKLWIVISSVAFLLVIGLVLVFLLGSSKSSSSSSSNLSSASNNESTTSQTTKPAAAEISTAPAQVAGNTVSNDCYSFTLTGDYYLVDGSTLCKMSLTTGFSTITIGTGNKASHEDTISTMKNTLDISSLEESQLNGYDIVKISSTSKARDGKTINMLYYLIFDDSGKHSKNSAVVTSYVISGQSLASESLEEIVSSFKIN